jgi:hypothetical protein
MNKVKKDTASEPDNTRNWDDFWDRFDIELFKNEGIAQLGRKYIKNGDFIYRHIPFDEFDKITPIPIVAKGITAFLASDDYMLREAVRGEGRNAGKGVQGFYQSYYDNCIKFLRHNEKCRDIFESKSDYELIQEHLKSEIKNLKESELLFTEFHVFGEDSEGSEYKKRERSFIEIVKQAAEEYPKWVRENKIVKEVPDTSQIVTGGNENQLAIKTRLIISNHIETIDNNLGWEYAFNNQDDYDLFLNLATGFFNYNPIPSPNQIIRLKHNCKTRFAKTLNLIYKELSNRTLKSDVEFFKLIRILNHFQNLTDIEIYNAVTR